MSLIKTTPNYRRVVLRLTEDALRNFGGLDCDRETAATLLAVWPCRALLDEELTAEVLSRFPAELVPVAGVHFLPGATAFSDAAKVIKVALKESPGGLLTAAALTAAKAKANVPTGRRFNDKDGELWAELSDGALQYRREREGPLLVLARGHVERDYGPLVEVTAQPTAEAVQS